MATEEQIFNKLVGKRNLYLISQTVRGGYDTFSDAVVAAWTEDEARAIHPDGSIYTAPAEDGQCVWAGWGSYDWANEPTQVSAQFIGIADVDIEGVICSSFHAG